MIRRGRLAIGLWLVFVATCAWLVGHARYTADLSAFLPRTPTQEQQLLVDQLKSGIASRLILIGIEGGDQAARARTAKAMATRLRADPEFLHVADGEMIGLERDRQILFEHRYLLSPAVTPDHFSVTGLNAAVTDSIDLLASSAGLFSKSLLPRDPTGEFLGLLDELAGRARPDTADGVWVSHDGQRALLLARTRAAGSDTDGQEQAVRSIRSAFQGAPSGLRLVMTGPGPFSVAARAGIKNEVVRLSGLAAVIIIGLLLLVYRSPMALALSLLPVLSGALAGVAAVSLGFDTIHGVTLGFGTALIGEAVDYSIYLLMQSEHLATLSGQPQGVWIATYWPTIRLGLLTSVCGFASLLFSGFPGLAQLGLYAIAGLVTAAAVTRFVLPQLLPPTLRIRDLTGFGTRLHDGLPSLSHLRWPLFGLFLIACLVLYGHRDRMWNKELAALSPVPIADQALDTAMRADLGAPDVRYLVVASAPDREAALAAGERVGEQLRGLMEAGVIAGFQSPAHFLPSLATQRRRLASLPDDQALRRRLKAAIVGLPLHVERFEPFFADVAATRRQRPLQRADLEGTSLAEGVDALLMRTDAHWTALLPLRVPAEAAQGIDAARVRASLAATGLEGVYFVDIKGESDRLYAGYLHEATQSALAGLAAILALQFLATRSLARLLAIVAPLTMAVVVVVAGRVLIGQPLNLLHLVGMLLIVAVGSNYALFFDRGAAAGVISPRTLASLAVATTTTVAGFGLLGFSSVPVLNAIGSTVGPGAILALLFSAILARHA